MGLGWDRFGKVLRLSGFTSPTPSTGREVDFDRIVGSGTRVRDAGTDSVRGETRDRWGVDYGFEECPYQALVCVLGSPSELVGCRTGESIGRLLVETCSSLPSRCLSRYLSRLRRRRGKNVSPGQECRCTCYPSYIINNTGMVHGLCPDSWRGPKRTT